MKRFFIDNKTNYWLWSFVAVAFILLFILLRLSTDSGNTGDEDGFQIPQGENVINYFKTEGKDTTCLNFKNNLQHYGSSFDVITVFIHQTFHTKSISQTRHKCNALMGWLAILIVGLIAYLIGGARAGIIAMVLLLLSPRFLGHSFNNPKDIPFATGIISAIYGMTLFFKQAPYVKWYTCLILTISIALAISVRIGGLILFGYFGLFGFVYIFRLLIQNKKKTKMFSNCKNKPHVMPLWKITVRIVVMGLAVSVAGYFLGLLLWPYALQSPIHNPIESYHQMSSFSTSIRQLFEGSFQWSDYLPWYYTPKFILMTIPVAVIIGLILFFILCWRKKEDRFWSFIIFFSFFFPVFWIVYTHANVYGGWRHAIFAYPPMVVAAALGFEGTIRFAEKKLLTEKNVSLHR